MKRHQQATTTCFPIRTELQRTAACREGFTILEVLISAGIMVIGLACVASLLPAAAQRMSQAVSEDRAAGLNRALLPSCFVTRINLRCVAFKALHSFRAQNEHPVGTLAP